MFVEIPPKLSISSFMGFLKEKMLIDNNYIKFNDIFKVKMPIDLNISYAEYLNQL